MPLPELSLATLSCRSQAPRTLLGCGSGSGRSRSRVAAAAPGNTSIPAIWRNSDMETARHAMPSAFSTR
ncbi:hypothetical protein D9598_18730 [Roseomonas sp. KE0001]|nr:hypothetical protein [Roseomonas sp. KE0001]